MTTNTNMPTESCLERRRYKPMDDYDRIQHIARYYTRGTRMSEIEKLYQENFGGSLPDYGSLDVKNIQGLIGNMKDKGRVLVYEDPESKETYVMCVRLAVGFREFLKLRVKKLLDRHGGNLPLSCFEAMYEKEFNKLNYHQFNLTDLDDLCDVLNLEVREGAVSQGYEIYNLRKLFEEEDDDILL